MDKVEAVSPGPGSDLKTVLAQSGPLTPARAVDVVRQIATAIEDAHANQTIHRDITTTTIQLSGADYAYLVDIESDSPAVDLTMLSYRAPELVTNSDVTYRSDIYALTAVLYECLTGVPPYRSVTADAGALLAARVDAPIPRPSEHRAGLPVGFDAVIERGMAKDPSDRYPTAAALAAAAQQAMIGATPLDVPSRQPTRENTAPPADTRTVELNVPVANSPEREMKPAPGNGPAVTYPPSQPLPRRSPPARRLASRPVAIVAIGTLVVAALVGFGAFYIPRLTRHGADNQTAAGSATPHAYSSPPAVLPFPVLAMPRNVSVDRNGNIYVLTDISGEASAFDYLGSVKHLLKLTPGASSPSTVTIPGFDPTSATRMTVDRAGTLYLSDREAVWEFKTGAARAVRLPFRNILTFEAIAVDDAGNVYAAGASRGTGNEYRVEKLIPGDTRPTDLPFNGLRRPQSLAVDHAGNVYVGTDAAKDGKILKLAAGSTGSVQVPLAGLREPAGLAFDASGTLFVADFSSGNVFEMQPGSSTANKLPMHDKATAVTTDAAGNVFVCIGITLSPSEQVLKPGQVLKFAPDH